MANGKSSKDITTDITSPDITSRLPSSTYDAAPDLLEFLFDYMYYDEEWLISPRVDTMTAFHLWKLADVFEIKPLFSEMQNKLYATIKVDVCEIPMMLGAMWPTMPQPIVDALVAQMAKYFFLFVAAGALDTLGNLPIAAIAATLSHTELQVNHADDVYRFVSGIQSAKKGDEFQEGHQKLWASVRFELLSPECKLAAKTFIEHHEHFSCQQALVGVLCRCAPGSSRVCAPASHTDAISFLEEGLHRQEDAKDDHAKKEITLDLFTYLILQGRELLKGEQPNGYTVVSKMIEKGRELHKEGWETMWLVEKAMQSLTGPKKYL